jgi:fimbrial chaperone protein
MLTAATSALTSGLLKCGWRLTVLVASVLLMPAGPGEAQGLTVSPVIVQMRPGERAAALTLSNNEDRDITVQIRSFAWSQTDETNENLAASGEILASPPIATIAPGASQVVRLVLRNPLQGREASYRILLDELPPAVEARRVRVELRFSIPVFAEPRERVAPHVQWGIRSKAGQAWLTAVNDGTQHQSFQDIELHMPDGRKLDVEFKTPPHILAGSTRHWPILTYGPAPAPASSVRLVARADSGSVEQLVRVDAAP